MHPASPTSGEDGGQTPLFAAGAQRALLDGCASARLCARLLLVCPVSFCRNGSTQSARSESSEPSSQLEEQSGCSQGSPRREGSLPMQSPGGPHQQERTVLTEPPNWVQKSNSWDIKPGQMFCSPTKNTGPCASGEEAARGPRCGGSGVGRNHLLQAKGQGTLSRGNGSE